MINFLTLIVVAILACAPVPVIVPVAPPTATRKASARPAPAGGRQRTVPAWLTIRWSTERDSDHYGRRWGIKRVPAGTPYAEAARTIAEAARKAGDSDYPDRRVVVEADVPLMGHRGDTLRQPIGNRKVETLERNVLTWLLGCEQTFDDRIRRGSARIEIDVAQAQQSVIAEQHRMVKKMQGWRDGLNNAINCLEVGAPVPLALPDERERQLFNRALKAHAEQVVREKQLAAYLAHARSVSDPAGRCVYVVRRQEPNWGEYSDLPGQSYTSALAAVSVAATYNAGFENSDVPYRERPKYDVIPRSIGDITEEPRLVAAPEATPQEVPAS